MASDVRKPPTAAVRKQHPQGVRGTCGWCGKPCEDKTPGKGLLKWWHDACSFEMGVIENPAQARDAVLDRDKGICTDCSEDWSERYILRSSGTNVIMCGGWDDPPEEQAQRQAERRAGFWCYSEVIWVSLWHVDHKTPLWKVRGMPALERLEYFKLANLVTRCHRCHERKTTEEAAERAKFNRIAAPPAQKQKPKFVSRQMGKRPPGSGNGFPPRGSTPMRKK